MNKRTEQQYSHFWLRWHRRGAEDEDAECDLLMEEADESRTVENWKQETGL